MTSPEAAGPETSLFEQAIARYNAGASSDELIGGGFNFTNPNATQTCGCGSSFAV